MYVNKMLTKCLMLNTYSVRLPSPKRPLPKLTNKDAGYLVTCAKHHVGDGR
jgi:hypothetical protein